MPISNGYPTSEVLLDTIFDYKTELDILNFYIGVDSLPTQINSPLRIDRGPSFRIDYNDNGNIRFYDFGGTNQKGGLFDLLMDLYKLTFNECLEKVYNEMILGHDLIKIKRNTSIKKDSVYKSEISKINVKVRPLRAHDIEFWGGGGITEEWLSFGDIHPISHMFITKNGKDMVIPCEKYAYAYIEFKDGVPTYKIYQPFSENYKWLNNHDRSVWDLWSKLPETGENIIITSSRKDALTIWANTGIPSTSGQAESVTFKGNVMDQIKSRFKNVFVLYDNDFDKPENYGRIYGKELAIKHNLIQIEIPEFYESKDPFQFRQKHGEEIFKNTFNFLINGK